MNMIFWKWFRYSVGKLLVISELFLQIYIFWWLATFSIWTLCHQVISTSLWRQKWCKISTNTSSSSDVAVTSKVGRNFQLAFYVIWRCCKAKIGWYFQTTFDATAASLQCQNLGTILNHLLMSLRCCYDIKNKLVVHATSFLRH